MFKKISTLILALVISSSAYADFVGPGASSYLVTVQAAYDLEDDETVILEGYLVSKVQKEVYVFKDSTGEIDVEIDDKILNNFKVTPDMLIRIRGEVDRDWFSILIDVDSVEYIAN
ncbi:YgiW/YdeI family stress tolerance OB fold protein [Methyloprofundus sp.]|uniref:YgiW/YdeI family stress tolerance OB fold protein n=1 Tax=Methyloprofundus sp. TaxID=2020875 RepID=UPI003D0F1881